MLTSKMSQKGEEEGNKINFGLPCGRQILNYFDEIYEVADHVFQFEERGIFPHRAEKDLLPQFSWFFRIVRAYGMRQL